MRGILFVVDQAANPVLVFDRSGEEPPRASSTVPFPILGENGLLDLVVFHTPRFYGGLVLWYYSSPPWWF